MLGAGKTDPCIRDLFAGFLIDHRHGHAGFLKSWLQIDGDLSYAGFKDVPVGDDIIFKAFFTPTHAVVAGGKPF